jgi:hypothetical protein
VVTTDFAEFFGSCKEIYTIYILSKVRKGISIDLLGTASKSSVPWFNP